MAKKGSKQKNREIPAWELGRAAVRQGPLGSMLGSWSWYSTACAYIRCNDSYPMGREDWAYVSSKGLISLNPRKKGTPKEWEYVISHCLLHLGFDHFRETPDPLWNTACDWVIAKFLRDSHIGNPPAEYRKEFPLSVKNEEQVYALLQEQPETRINFGTTFSGRPDMVWDGKPEGDFTKLLADSLQESIQKALENAKYSEQPSREKSTVYTRAKDWFISNYPLLGALAASFRIVDDREAVRRMDISVAAVNPMLQEIYINPMADLDAKEWRFVLAHEFLHAALRHDLRCEDRNPELWNVACDYIINGWLREMGVGAMPDFVLYDPAFQGMSAEGLYDLLYGDIRFYLKQNKGDILYGNCGCGHWTAEELDRFYQSAMHQGLACHQQQSRGALPAALIEEIYAMSRPPIRWDVELAKWFDEYFTLPEKHRTYARMSRRQSATPDIPRPAWRSEEDVEPARIFAVVLDTSGSMERHLLAAALGTIASYSEAREVRHIRLVFCDAAPYDQGVIGPEEIAGAVRVQGRGGTRLQPGIDLLDNDPKFPKDAPVLLITDGMCDRLNLHGRNHAFLIPWGRRLPFPPKGPVFRLK